MRLRTSITLLVLLGIVAGTAWYGWQQFSTPADNPFADPRCVDQRIAEGDRLSTRRVKVNVYNAGNRDGLAGETLARLGKQRFVTGVADNAPTRIRVRTVAIYHPEPRSAEVRLVREQFNGQVDVRRKPDIANGVDVVVGSGFRGLARKAPRSIQLSNAQQVCVAAAD